MSFHTRKSGIMWNNWSSNFNTLVVQETWKHQRFEFVNIRFTYHIELYCIEFLNYLLLINIYFLTDLKFFKKTTSLTGTSESINWNTFFI